MKRVLYGPRVIFLSTAVIILFAALCFGPGLAPAFAINMASPIVIDNSDGGGGCSSIGIWDAGSSTCTLTTDIHFTTGTLHGYYEDGIRITSDNIHLAGNGHQVICDSCDVSYGSGTGIDLMSSGNTVEGLTANGWVNGILVNSSHGNHVENNSIGDGYNFQSIVLNSASGNSISGNTVGGDYGIFVNNSVANDITGNSVSPNLEAIILVGANDNSLGGNTIQLPGMGKGIHVASSDGVTISGNTLNGDWSNQPVDGILIESSNHASVVGNYVSNAMMFGIEMSQSSGNWLAGNQTSGNLYGIGSQQSTPSSDNEFYGNTMSDTVGVLMTGDRNTFYGNKFLFNNQQADVTGTGNIFNLPLPIGGNYWSDWTSPDINNDGFVDSPYVFNPYAPEQGQDNLPLAASPTLLCGKPQLGLDLGGAHWASYADYTIGNLTVAWTVSNTGSDNAYGIRLTDSINNQGVTLITPVPLTLGGIRAGSSVSAQLKYHIPAGVHSWNAGLKASGIDACSQSYSFPG